MLPQEARASLDPRHHLGRGTEAQRSSCPRSFRMIEGS